MCDYLNVSDIDWEQFFKDLQEKHTPNEDGSCKTEGCKGLIVRQVTGLFRGQYECNTPTCDACGRSYTHAKIAPIVGVEAFNRSLNRPMTF